VVAFFFVGVEAAVKDVREEEDFEYGEKDEKLDKNQHPQRFTPCEVLEAVYIHGYEAGK
jgi:hypothetical protein